MIYRFLETAGGNNSFRILQGGSRDDREGWGGKYLGGGGVYDRFGGVCDYRGAGGDYCLGVIASDDAEGGWGRPHVDKAKTTAEYCVNNKAVMKVRTFW